MNKYKQHFKYTYMLYLYISLQTLYKFIILTNWLINVNNIYFFAGLCKQMSYRETGEE